MQYRVCTRRQNEMDVRTIEYDSKCESRRFFSACAQNPNYAVATWDRREDDNQDWARLAKLTIAPNANMAANRG